MTQSDVPHAETSDPQNKTELLARIRAARTELENTISGLDDAALSAPGPEGWAVKDHLAHLAAWSRKVLSNMDGITSPAALGVPEDVYQRGDWVEINEIVRAPDKDRPAADIVAEYRSAHAALLARIEALPEADLFGPDDKLRNNIRGNSYDHDHEHQPWIEAVIRYHPDK